MAACRNICLLLWRNYVKRRRSLCSFCCELFFPIIIVALFIALYQAFSLTKRPDKMYFDNWSTVSPLAGVGYRFANASQRLALVKGDGADASVDDIISLFNATLAQWYPTFDPSVVFPSGSVLASAIPFIPSLATLTTYFPSETALRSYVKGVDYTFNGNEEVDVAIVFMSGSPNWEYKIRVNNSEIPDTSASMDNVAITSDTTDQYLYLSPQRVYRANQKPLYPIQKVQKPGFSSYQLLVDRFILNKTAAAPLTQSTVQNLVFSVAQYLVLPQYAPLVANFINQYFGSPQFLAALPAFQALFRAEQQLPQQVSVMPFPTTAYETNPFYSITSTIFAFLFSFSFLYPASRLLRDIVSEKELKMREGMRAMGLGTGSLLTSWYVTYIFIVLFQSIFIAIITNRNIFKGSNGGIIFLLFLLFGLSTMSFCMVISVFFSRAKTAMVMGVLLLFGSIFPYIGVSGAAYSYSSKMAASMLPATAFALCLDRIAILENADQGVTNANIGIRSGNYSVGDGFGMMFLMLFVFLVATWYLDNVIPSEFGVPRSPWFPFTLDYWAEMCPCKRRHKQAAVATLNQLANATPVLKPGQHQAIVEAPDSRMNALEEAGKVIALKGLRKEFKSQIDKTATRVAVDGVDLTMYEGQIFVLLGHNGAGKTTTASMITGLLAPSAGRISVYGRPVPEALDEVRYDIGMGVCPQHDVLYHDLTVKEHLELFAGIKGVARGLIPAAVTETIATVGLTEKTNALSASLSGGQKRKLSVGIALIGGSKVVILDEPTSGMDPYSRRSTWQMLKNAREGRIMILTTHFMDEADLLGDRIAIMSNGRVACCGSPLFLKGKYGVGYQMTMLKANGTKVDEVTAIVKTVPGAELMSNVGTELSYRLPIQESALLPTMFATLDTNLDRLGLVSYGVGVTTMEEVFLRVAQEQLDDAPSADAFPEPLVPDASRPSSSDKTQRVNVRPAELPPSSPLMSGGDEEGGHRATLADLMKHARHDGKGMFFRHMRALLLKRFQYFKRDLKGFLFLVFIPIAVVLAIVALISSNPFSEFPDLVLDTKPFNLGQAVPNRMPYLDYKTSSSPVGPPAYPDITALMGQAAVGTDTPMEISLNTYISNSSGFVNTTNSRANQYPLPPVVLGLELMNEFLLNNKTHYKESKYGAFVFDGGWNGEPQPNDTLAYTFLQNTTSYHATGIFVNVMNNAIYKNLTDSSHSIKVHNFPLPWTKRQDVVLSSFLSFFIALGIVIGFAFVSAFYASFLVYERENNVKHQQLISGVGIGAYWVSTFLWDQILFQLPMWGSIIILKAFDITQLMGSYKLTQATILLFFFFGSCTAGLTYCLTYLFKSASNAQNVVIFLNVICMFLIMASFIMSQVSSTCKYDQHLQYVYMLLPAFSVGYGFVKLAFLDILPSLEASCNGGLKPGAPRVVYEPLDMNAAGVNIVYLATLTVFYFALAIALDYMQANPWFRKLFVSKPNAVTSSTGPVEGEDSDVAEERARINAGAGQGDVLTLRNLRKQYGTGTRVAVKSLSFTVPIGQCFGFLGINGAGKTTTLKMLSGEILPTSGDAKIAGFDILTQQLQLRRLLGYCPQFDALYDLLTVREHLELFARIKGIDEEKVGATVMSLITLMDLSAFENKRAGTLSGGNKRKLSVAIALIGEPPVVFLDEPSTGMDPVSRRKLWNIISRVVTERRICSVILTTHSMEECEALCARLGIMVDGSLQCLGSIQHLKGKFGSGFSAEFKLGEPPAALLEAVTKRLWAANGGRGQVDSLSVGKLCADVGLPIRAAQLSETGTGWAVFSALQRGGSDGIPLAQFAEWWADEDQADGLRLYITTNAFPGAQLVERHGSKLYFHLPPQTVPLSVMFGRLEHAKTQLNILEYSLSQTTLEQIFNKFAAKQEGEHGIARGMVEVEEAKAGPTQVFPTALTSPPKKA